VVVALSAGRFALGLVLIAIAAFSIRAVYIVTVTRNQPVRFYDEVYYRGEAANLARGDGFELPRFFITARGSGAHPPMTGLALTPAAALTDDNEVAMRVTVALAGVGCVVLIGLIGQAVAGPVAGLVGAGVAAAYPNLWMNDGLLLSETFATLGTAAVVFFTYRLIRKPTWKDAVGAGVACAIAMLSRAELALLLPLLVVPAVLMIRGLIPARRLRLAGVAVLAAAVTVAPWEVYLLSHFKEPAFLSYGQGGVLAGANCDRTYYGPLIGTWWGHCEVRDDREPSVAAAKNREDALHYMRAHLSRLPLVIAVRVARVWSIYRPFQMADLNVGEGRPKWASLVGWSVFWPLVGLAGAGIVILRRRKIALLPLLTPILIVTLIAAAFYGLVRFRAPAEVSIVVLAAVGLDTLVRRTRRSTPKGWEPRSNERGDAPTKALHHTGSAESSSRSFA
jgi:4-amino-4-deoxy-L-arabinose transferase-like glycosyltransferase